MQKLRQLLRFSKALGPSMEEEGLRGGGGANPGSPAAVAGRDTRLHMLLISFPP